ncbi:MAG: chorismate mutase [Pseudomonadota bacterium]
MTDRVEPTSSEDAQAAPLPEQCNTMEDVRAGVDAVDRVLVSLLARRQGYMEAAARIKPQLSDVRVPWRVEEVVQNVLAEAPKSGLSPRIAERIWRLLVEECILHEHETWLSLRKSESEKDDLKQTSSQ